MKTKYFERTKCVQFVGRKWTLFKNQVFTVVCFTRLTQFFVALEHITNFNIWIKFHMKKTIFANTFAKVHFPLIQTKSWMLSPWRVKNQDEQCTGQRLAKPSTAPDILQSSFQDSCVLSRTEGQDDISFIIWLNILAKQFCIYEWYITVNIRYHWYIIYILYNIPANQYVYLKKPIFHYPYAFKIV